MLGAGEPGAIASRAANVTDLVVSGYPNLLERVRGVCPCRTSGRNARKN